MISLLVLTIILAAVLGNLVARSFSEPMNRRLRKCWADGTEKLGAAIDGDLARTTAAVTMTLASAATLHRS